MRGFRFTKKKSEDTRGELVGCGVANTRIKRRRNKKKQRKKKNASLFQGGKKNVLHNNQRRVPLFLSPPPRSRVQRTLLNLRAPRHSPPKEKKKRRRNKYKKNPRPTTHAPAVSKTSDTCTQKPAQRRLALVRASFVESSCFSSFSPKEERRTKNEERKKNTER